MLNKEAFENSFVFDPASPTKLKTKKHGKVAGYKNKAITCRYKDNSYCWSIPRILFELYNGFEPPRNMFVVLKDGNRNNLEKHNLILSSYPF